MIRLGITGGMGSGKSVVIFLLKTMGIPVYIADDEAKKITSTSLVVKEKLINYFGNEIFDDNILNKTLFASLIFENEDNLKKANSIIHSEVLKDFLSWSEKQKVPLVAIESAILFESGFDAYVDKIICVTTPVEICIERVMKRSGLSRTEILKRISNQIPEQQKAEKSDYVICNDGIELVIPQVEKVLENILY